MGSLLSELFFVYCCRPARLIQRWLFTRLSRCLRIGSSLYRTECQGSEHSFQQTDGNIWESGLPTFERITKGLNGSNPTLKEDLTIPEDCLIEMKAKNQEQHSH